MNGTRLTPTDTRTLICEIFKIFLSNNQNKATCKQIWLILRSVGTTSFQIHVGSASRSDMDGEHEDAEDDANGVKDEEL